MKIKHSNGIWIWNLDKLRNDYLNVLKQIKCKRVYLKVLDDASQGIYWSWQCTPQIVNTFEKNGIEVWGWGYIFDGRYSTDIDGIIDSLRRAVGCGIKGFVFDVETEVKNQATHGQLREILKRSQEIIPKGCLGYTSFGYPKYHPEVPWKMLNDLCDLQFPQIYFEKFTFGPGSPGEEENKKEVEACIQSHKELGLDKPILPIFGSESDSQYPASSQELQGYLAQYLGSSLWRAPNSGERGEAWNCTYDYALEIDIDDPKSIPSRPYKPAPLIEPSYTLPINRTLEVGDQGEDVYVLICALMGLGFLKKQDQVSDKFDINVDDAVRYAQRTYKIEVDGIVGPITKSRLEQNLSKARGIIPDSHSGSFNGVKFAEYCESILKQNTPWTPDIKFVQPFVNVLGKQRWAWCGATVYWLINEFLYKPNGQTMKIQYPGMEYNFARVECFQQYFQEKGWYEDNRAGYIPPTGAIVMFDWDQININEPDRDGEDHIGIFLRMNGDLFVCAEGNTDHSIVGVGRTAIKERKRHEIQGFGVIPEGWLSS